MASKSKISSKKPASKTIEWSEIELVKRHPSIFTRDNSALLMIDMQERLIPAMSNRYELIKNSELILQIANLVELPIIVTEQYPKGLGKTVEKFNELTKAATFFEKTSFSAVGEKNFTSFIEENHFKKIAIIGIETHVCILQTALDLKIRNIEVTVVADAVASRRDENKKIALEKMKQAGVWLATAESLIFDLLEKSGSDEFKKAHELVMK
ncbi:MAG: hydrolase [Candidatus Hydrogenedentes bacterium CG07_land_8_20_14_0_80_42_17]|nr:MAG: hydrolase [Candidatus Hydrogenedentes bacterium CG07_land_8_20_14_0_80_42_17]